MKPEYIILFLLTALFCKENSDDGVLFYEFLSGEYRSIAMESADLWGRPELIDDNGDDNIYFFYCKPLCRGVPIGGITRPIIKELRIIRVDIYIALDLCADYNMSPAVVLAHEMGHGWGFGHSENSSDLMHGMYGARIPSSDELEAVEQMEKYKIYSLINKKFIFWRDRHPRYSIKYTGN